jgi:integrase/recombinase XerD
MSNNVRENSSSGGKDGNLAQLTRVFLEKLRENPARAARTIRSYERSLERFFDWAKSQGQALDSPQEISAGLIEAYQNFLRQSFKASTGNFHLVVLRKFLKFLGEQGQRALEPAEIMFTSSPRDSIDFLSSEELERLLETAWKGQDSLLALRNRAILSLLYSTGLRLNELIRLNRGQINLEQGELQVNQPEPRGLFLSQRTQTALRAYLMRRTDSGPALFIRTTHPGLQEDLRISARTVERVVAQGARRAGLAKKVSPHTLRHSLAVDLRAAGLPLKTVQKILGYLAPTSSISYPEVRDRQLTELHQRYLRAYAPN